MHILFSDIFVFYLARVIIFIISLSIFMWRVLHSKVIDHQSCVFNTHSFIVDFHSCALHIYCFICSTGGYFIFYCIQDVCFLIGSHSWCLVCSVIIHCLLLIIIWRTVGIDDVVFTGCVGAGAITVLMGCTILFVIGAVLIGCIC